MASNYQEAQRRKSIEKIQKSKLFENEKAGKHFRGIPRDFVLQDELKNIFEPVRNDVVQYFKQNKISWWGGSKPTGHVLSSQVACVNHLYAIRNDKKAVLQLLSNISTDFIDVLLIESDSHLPAFIQFESVSDGSYLNEGVSTRGTLCTSIDALIYALHRDGSKWIIPIEWKYTEYYNNQNKALEGYNANPQNYKGKVRLERYTALINNSPQLSCSDHKCYYYEPFYQLMRQTLWAEQMIQNKDKERMKADNFLHVHVIPSENNDLLGKIYKCSGQDMETTWVSHLKDTSKYAIVSPEKLLSNCLNDSKYNKLKEYLSERYW